jgi:hypothetical protein
MFVPTTLVQNNLLNKLFLYVFKQIKQHTGVKHTRATYPCKTSLKVLSNKLPYAMERTITDGTNNQRHVYPEYDDCPGSQRYGPSA